MLMKPLVCTLFALFANVLIAAPPATAPKEAVSSDGKYKVIVYRIEQHPSTWNATVSALDVEMGFRVVGVTGRAAMSLPKDTFLDNKVTLIGALVDGTPAAG